MLCGAVFADARGDVFRGLEVAEQACGVGVAMMGETLAGVAKGMDTHSYREPLGVCAGKAALKTLKVCVRASVRLDPGEGRMDTANVNAGHG